KESTMCCKRTLPGKLLLLFAAVGLVIGLGRLVNQETHAEGTEEKQPQVKTPAALDFEMQTLEGDDIKLNQYHGDVVLMVNVASKCGLTKQYKQLQKLHEEYAEQGLSILGFPANNFGKQEPGTDEEIATFCEQNYGVEFDMFAKLSVKGDDQAPLYAFLTGKKTNPEFAGDISWNFEKFLVSRDGQVIARFSPRTKPNAKEVIKAIEDAIAQPVPKALSKGKKRKAGA
ncbi:MAG: glutathione peroxidase, partial [Phycisphaeraceae bacterium]